VEHGDRHAPSQPELGDHVEAGAEGLVGIGADLVDVPEEDVAAARAGRGGGGRFGNGPCRIRPLDIGFVAAASPDQRRTQDGRRSRDSGFGAPAVQPTTSAAAACAAATPHPIQRVLGGPDSALHVLGLHKQHPRQAFANGEGRVRDVVLSGRVHESGQLLLGGVVAAGRVDGVDPQSERRAEQSRLVRREQPHLHHDYTERELPRIRHRPSHHRVVKGAVRVVVTAAAQAAGA
jgi:hypothetical protein